MNFKKFGKYTIIKKIASGGMADILLASELSPTGFGRFCVIKRALSKFSENEEFKDMFKNEGKVACNLKHKNITTIHEFGIEKNQFFLAMEYISGKNLREFIKKLQARNKPISIPSIIYIIKEVSAGLNYAHNAIDTNTGQPLNIIHRDVSPQNIMLTFDGQIKLIDFGIAKIADTNLTRAGHLKGKFSYMSPEQASGHELDVRADIFCLGIIFWELLTNKRLFASNNELVSLKKVRNCDIPDAKKINPNIPSKLIEILNKTLSKNKASRYSSAAKLEQDLNLFLNKNYPEYSHYDFITLMKETYRKEIMSERESLKTYSVEFKKYTNSLNIEKSFSNQVVLDMPDITTLNASPNASKNTQVSFSTTFAKKDTKSENFLSSPSHFFEASQNKPVEESISKTVEKSSTLIQRKETVEALEETQTKGKERSKTQNLMISPEKTLHTQLMNNQEKSLKLKITNPDLKLDHTKSKQHTTNQSKLTTTLLSQYSKDFEQEEEKNLPQFKKAVFLSVALLIIGGFSIGAFWILKNETKNTVEMPVQSTPSQITNYDTNHARTSQRSPSQSNLSVQNKSIYISSNPSNASIYINNKTTTKYTPSKLTLNLEDEVLITVKKKGFISRQISLNSRNFKSNIFIKLAKDNKKPQKPQRTQIIQ